MTTVPAERAPALPHVVHYRQGTNGTSFDAVAADAHRVVHGLLEFDALRGVRIDAGCEARALRGARRLAADVLGESAGPVEIVALGDVLDRWLAMTPDELHAEWRRLGGWEPPETGR